jgi:hypothetical protein
VSSLFTAAMSTVLMGTEVGRRVGESESRGIVKTCELACLMPLVDRLLVAALRRPADPTVLDLLFLQRHLVCARQLCRLPRIAQLYVAPAGLWWR